MSYFVAVALGNSRPDNFDLNFQKATIYLDINDEKAVDEVKKLQTVVFSFVELLAYTCPYRFISFFNLFLIFLIILSGSNSAGII